MVETLREVVEELAPLRRRAGSDDERTAAEWLAERLRRAGAREVRVEDAPFHDGYARMMLPLPLLALFGGRLGALLSAALIADDAANGLRPWRRLVQRTRTTTNVIAEVGDAESPVTLVVLAHHDAAPTGVVFDQSFQRWLARRFPDLVARTDESLPLWWAVLAGPLLTAAGFGRTGRALTVLTGVLALDIARERIVPGANDNLSGVAALVALAERDHPVRVVLASCGAEEVLQGGIYDFTRRHLKPGDFVLNLDTVGSPELFMIEGEGVLWIEDYCDPSFRDLVARAAERALGRPLRRGCRARTSTDSVVPSRAGHPTATLCSWEPDTKLLSNYHLPTDTPDRLRYDTVASAVEVAAAVAEDLAGAS